MKYVNEEAAKKVLSKKNGAKAYNGDPWCEVNGEWHKCPLGNHIWCDLCAYEWHKAQSDKPSYMSPWRRMAVVAFLRGEKLITKKAAKKLLDEPV